MFGYAGGQSNMDMSIKPLFALAPWRIKLSL